MALRPGDWRYLNRILPLTPFLEGTPGRIRFPDLQPCAMEVGCSSTIEDPDTCSDSDTEVEYSPERAAKRQRLADIEAAEVAQYVAHHAPVDSIPSAAAAAPPPRASLMAVATEAEIAAAQWRAAMMPHYANRLPVYTLAASDRTTADEAGELSPCDSPQCAAYYARAASDIGGWEARRVHLLHKKHHRRPPNVNLQGITNMKAFGAFNISEETASRWFGSPGPTLTPPTDGATVVFLFSGTLEGPLLGKLRAGMRIACVKALEISGVCRDLSYQLREELLRTYSTQLKPGALHSIFDWAEDFGHNVYALTGSLLHRRLPVPDIVSITPPLQGMSFSDPLRGFQDARCRALVPAVAAVMEWHRLLVDDRMTEQPSTTGAVFAYWVTHAFSRGELNADIQQVYRFLNDVFDGGMSSTAGWHMMMHEASW
jgi:hypothetical protein